MALTPEAQRAAELMADWPTKSQITPLKLATGQSALSILIPTALPQSSGAIILFPEFSQGPAQQGITQYLSSNFPLHGWAVQLLNSPDFDLWGQGLPDATTWSQSGVLLASRLQAALDTLSTRGFRNIVLIAQGGSGLALIKELASSPPPAAVRGIILLAPPLWPEQQPHPIADALPKLNIPVLIEYDHASLPDQPGCVICVRIAAQLHKDMQEYFQPDRNANFPSSASIVATTLLNWLDLRAGHVLPVQASPDAVGHQVP